MLPPGLEIGTVIAIDDAGVTWSRGRFRAPGVPAPARIHQIVPPEQLEEMQREMYGPPLPPGFVATDTSYSPDPLGNPADPPPVTSGSAP